MALHSADIWTVAILDGTEPPFEKRGAQVNLVLQSLRPRSYQRESFAGRKALPLTPERIEVLKTFVETSMKKLGVPGVSRALIDHRFEPVHSGHHETGDDGTGTVAPGEVT